VPVPLEPPDHLLANLRDLPRYITPSTAGAAVVGCLIAFTGPALLLFQAAANAKLSPGQLDSWLLAVYAGGGATSLVLALLYRQPICGAYPIAGTALLVSALPRYTLSEAVGAYLVAGLLILLLGLSGLFGRAMNQVPAEIVMGMLAGVLFRFGLGIFTPLANEPWFVLAMVVAFLVVERLRWRSSTLVALGVGLALAAASGRLGFGQLRLEIARPELIAPSFGLDAALSLSLPLTLLLLTSQNAPGIGVLRSLGYKAPSNAITFVCGLASIITAPLGGHGICIASPMTAICAAPNAHPDPRGRYVATFLNGLLMIAFGLLGSTVASVMFALPVVVAGVVAGLAMVPAIIHALRHSVGQERLAYGAFFALAIAASDVTLLGIGAPFWSLVGGLAVSRVLDEGKGGIG
jgi:benzoate membrane transport protein